MYNIPNPYDPEEYQPTDINLPKQQVRHHPNTALGIGFIVCLLIVSLWLVPFALAESQASSIHAIAVTPTLITDNTTTIAPGSSWWSLLTFPTSTPTVQPTNGPVVTTAPNRPIPTSCSTCGQSAQPSPVATVIVTPTLEPTATPSPDPTPTIAPSPTPTATPTQQPTPEPIPSPTQQPSPTATPTQLPTVAPTDTPVPTNPLPTSIPTQAPTAIPTQLPVVPTAQGTVTKRK